MSLLTVIGMGNRLYCDDGIGNSVVEALAAKNSDSHIEYVVGETDVDWAIARIKTKYIILIDAVKMGKAPGTVQQMLLDDMATPVQNEISMHNCHLLNFLRLDFSGLVIGIEPYEISLKFGLSSPMKYDFDNIVVQANKIIQNYVMELLCFDMIYNRE